MTAKNAAIFVAYRYIIEDISTSCMSATLAEQTKSIDFNHIHLNVKLFKIKSI